MMNRSQRAQAAGRDRGHRRVSQTTRWTGAGGVLAVAVIGVVLAQGPASASGSTAASTQPGDATGAGGQVGLGGAAPYPSPSSPQPQYVPQYGGQSGGGGLQAPAAPPQSFHGSGPSVRSGAS